MSLKRRLARIAGGLTQTHIVHRSEVHQVGERLHLKRFLKHFGVDCVFDVGANVGQYATQLRREIEYTGWIVSFEPLPELAEGLESLARSDPKWLICPMALDRETGPATFNMMADTVFSSFHEPRCGLGLDRQNTVARKVQVQRSTLARELPKWREMLGFSRPFLKLDTQGHDLAVVEGAGDAIREFVGLQSELSFERLYEDSPAFAEALAAYQQRGFRLSALVTTNLGHHFPRLIEADCIMYREDLA